MKHKTTAFVLIFILMLHFTSAAAPADIKCSVWAKNEVSALYNENMMPDGMDFILTKNITREKFCEMIILFYERVTGKKVTAAKTPFTDTDNAAVAAAYQLGIVSGVSQTSFAPLRGIKREEVASMLVRAINRTGMTALDKNIVYSLYSDNSDISSYAANDIYFLRRIGVMQGCSYNLFKPRHPLSAEQAASLVMRAYNLVKKPLSPSYGKYTVAIGSKSVYIGQSSDELVKIFGQPTRIDVCDRTYDWYVYAADLKNYMMAGVLNGTVVAVCTTAQSFVCEGAVAGKTAPAGFASDASVEKRLLIDSLENGKVYGVYLRYIPAGFKSVRFSAAAIKTYETQCSEFINALRVMSGLSLLTADTAASTAARAHSADMALKNYFAHTSLSGKTPFERLTAAGIKYSAAAENIARGYDEAVFAVDSWYNRAGHRANITGAYTRMGLGAAYSAERPAKSYYITQEFYKP